jgi:hypothetical protein
MGMHPGPGAYRVLRHAGQECPVPLVPLDWLKGKLRSGRKHNPDRVSGNDLPAAQHDAHDSGLSDQLTLGISGQHFGKQAGLVSFDLGARITQAGDLDHRVLPDMQDRVLRQAKYIKSANSQVLSHLAGQDLQALSGQFIQKFGCEKMHLTQVRLRRIPRNARAVTNQCPTMGVALDPQSGKQADRGPGHFGKAVQPVCRNRNDKRLGWLGGVKPGHPLRPSSFR